MVQMGLTAKDLAPAIGRQNRVYEVLNRKRELTLPISDAITNAAKPAGKVRSKIYL